MPTVTDRDLDRFGQWLLDERGCSETTVAAYRGQLDRALAHGDWLACIRDKALAPKTRHQARAAVRAWARFASDADLAMRASNIKLPSAERKSVRRPLDESTWTKLKDRVANDNRLSPQARASLEMIVIRGLRVGDVLRLKAHDVKQALRSGRLRFLAKGEKWIEISAKPVADQLTVLNTTPWGESKNVAGLLLGSGGEGLPAYHLARRKLDRAFKRIGGKLGIDEQELYMHRMRRTVVVSVLTQLRDDPMASQKATRFMGWQGKATIQEYIDYVAREEIDALDDLL